MSNTTKQNILLIIFFGLLIASLFSPIASNEYIPNMPDFANYIAAIVQAKQALDEGQFPIHIAPSLYDGSRYAYFQFSSPLTYTITGAIYKWITPGNPFFAFKITLWIALMIAGIYIFRLINEFVRSRGIALLAATLYLLSPFLMINIGVRGDLPESVAIGIIPLVLYYTIQCHNKYSLRNFIFTALAWFALATIHLVSFVFTSIFIGLFLICINVQDKAPVKNLLFVGLAYGFAWILALWYLAPAALYAPYFYAHHILSNPYYKNWLNPLPTLLSASAVSPMPLPGNGRLVAPFYVGIGWPMLISIGVVVYKKVIDFDLKISNYVTSLLCLFALAFILAWSPFNFWKFFPESIKLLQFGFRLLIQMMWIGTILFAVAIAGLFNNKLEVKYVALGILLIAMANSSWLQTNHSSEKRVQDIVLHPVFDDWGARAFVVSPLLLPYTNHSGYIVPVEKTRNLCQLESGTVVCEMNVLHHASLVQLPILYYSDMLNIKVDGQPVDYQPVPYDKVKKDILIINPMLVGVFVSKGKHIITEKFVGLIWANWISIVAWIAIVLIILQRVLFTRISLVSLRHRMEIRHKKRFSQ